MKNNTITIYELMGLIKDNKAPYEIIYKNSKYFIDELEEYYKREDGTPLFEHIFDNYNDYDSLQERVEVLSGENDEWEDIEDKLNYQYAIVPEYFDLKKALETINANFEKHQKALTSIIKNQKYLKDKLDGKDVL